MKNTIILLILSIVIIYFYNNKESLSISQFPNSKCKSSNFYNCNNCNGKFYQKQNKVSCNNNNYDDYVYNPELNIVPIDNTDIIIEDTKQINELTESDIFNYLDKGGLIISCIDGETANFILTKLAEHTIIGKDVGFPDFYYINGPIIVLKKVKEYYYWMIDYPIKYTPANINNFANKSINRNDLKQMFYAGRRLLNNTFPVYFMNN